MLSVFIAQLQRRASDATTSSQAASTIGQSRSLAIGNENPNPRVFHSTQLPRAGPQDGSQDDTQPREFLMVSFLFFSFLDFNFLNFFCLFLTVFFFFFFSAAEGKSSVDNPSHNLHISFPFEIQKVECCVLMK